MVKAEKIEVPKGYIAGVVSLVKGYPDRVVLYQLPAGDPNIFVCPKCGKSKGHTVHYYVHDGRLAKPEAIVCRSCRETVTAPDEFPSVPAD